MAEAARADGPDLTDVPHLVNPRERRPSLTVVPDDTSSSTSTGIAAPAEPRVGRSGMIGAVIGFVVASTVMTVVCTLAGMGAGPAFGIGIFTGFWGGGGFGFMMGATVPLSHYMDAVHPTRPRRSTTVASERPAGSGATSTP
jgi:hypothetical protein